MAKLSVLIPARNERFLGQTVKDVLSKATGDVEIIICLDGTWPDPYDIPEDKRVVVIYKGTPQGMRPAINSCASIAHGDFFMKLDAHCMLAESFDEILASECENNWVVVPRRYSLDAENWVIKKDKPPIDYHYLSYPLADKEDYGLHGRYWRQRCEERKDILLDSEMSSQGSCWFMSRKHWDWLGGLSVEGYGDFIQEFQEIGCKTWLGGGEVRVNKKTWYSHLFKGRQYGRGYFISRDSWHRGLRYSTDFWVNNRWTARIHDFSWLIEKFWPIPTWPNDWQEQLYSQGHGERWCL